MAKGWEIEGIRPNQPLRERARLIIQTKFREAFYYRTSVSSSEDPETVHNMRVSLRRLWAAMTGFGDYFRTDPKYPRLARRTRRLASRLGKVRDLDVLIELLQNYTKKEQTNEVVLQAIDDIISDCVRRRIKQQIKLLGYLEKLKNKQFEEKFLAFFDQDETLEMNTLNGNSAIFSAALSEFYAHQPQDNSCDAEALHQLRIAAKKLRYSLEFFEICYQRQLASYLKLMRQLQELLGDIHDCDVMVELLSSQRQAKQSMPENSYLVSGFSHLINDFQNKRCIMAAEFLKLWHFRFQRGFQTRLERILNQPS